MIVWMAAVVVVLRWRCTSFVSRITLAVICQLALGDSMAATAAGLPELCYTTFHRVLSLQQQRSLSLWQSLPLLDSLPFPLKQQVDRLCQSLHNIVSTVVAERQQRTEEERSPELTTQSKESGKEDEEEKENGWKEERGRWEEYVCSDATGDAAAPTPHNDLLSMLLASNASAAEPLWRTNQEISEELLAFILAGHESTTNLITWTVYLLLQHPQVLADLNDESSSYPSSEPHSVLSLSSTARPVLDAILMESLRLYPPAPILLRQTQRPTTLHALDRHGGGNRAPLHLPAGAVIVSNAYVIHRQQAVWGDKASEFDYRRWMERRRGVSSGGSGGVSELFVPFGAGGRSCVGMTLAMLEAKVVLLTMLERMEMRLCDGQQVVPDIKLTMKPKHGLRVMVKPRTASW